MQLDIILRGQSNAAYFAELDKFAGAGRLTSEVEALLGFDGKANTVRLIYDRDGTRGDTVYPATAFLGEWMQPNGRGGWAAGRYETEFLARMGDYRAEGMGDATAMVWLHSEYDSRDPGLSTAGWSAAVRGDAALVRQTLGRDVPYHFVAAHPYGDGTDTGHQAIRAGMERLDADPALNARIAARAPDINASLDDNDSNPATTEHGGAHITAADAQVIAPRIARSIAEGFAAYAQPGSPVALAGGNIASDGPRVISAQALDPARLQVDVRHDGAAGFLPLSAVAAKGAGWSIAAPDGTRVAASSATVLDADSLFLDFAASLRPGWMLDYAWGKGRTAEPGGPGLGNAVLDTAGLPAWTPAEGVPVMPALAAPGTDPIW